MKISAKSKKTFADITLLYVEDTPEILGMNSEGLSKFFKKVDQATNGMQGWDLYQKNIYDIVISDIQMPEMDGLELSEKIKEANPDQSIVITSAYDDSPSLMRLVKIGVSNFILKPFAISQLLDTLLPIATSIKNQQELDKYRQNLEVMVAEKSLEITKQNHFLHNIIQSLKTPFVVVDANSFLIIEGNQEALALEAIGKTNIHQLLCDQKEDCQGRNYPCAVKMALTQKEPVGFEKIMNYKNLGPRFIRVEAFPILNEFGEVEKTLVYLVDVTSGRQKEIGHIAEEGKLKFQLVNQSLVADLAKILNSAASFKSILKSALFFIGGSLDVPKVAVFRMNIDQERFDLLEDISSYQDGVQIQYLDRIYFKDMNIERINRLKEGGTVIFHDLEKMNSTERAICEKHRIGSLLMQPIVIRNVTIGILAFFHHKGHFWNYKSYALYASISNLLASTWARSE